MEYAPQDAVRDAPQDAGQGRCSGTRQTAPPGGHRGAEDSGLTIRELEAQITELAGHLNAANHRWLVLIAEFDRRNGWSDGATQSCAHWLSWKCGLDLGAAREKVRVAKAIAGLPQISMAMANGRLSFSKVRALTRVATPATEVVLLNVALHGTTHHVETLVRQFRRVQEVEELSREERQYSGRRLSYHHDDDGSLVVKLQLTAESGALFLRAIEAALPEIALPDDCKDSLHVSAETSGGNGSGAANAFASRHAPLPSHSMRRADALVVLAESFLQHGAAAMKGGDRHQVVLHVDEATLRHGEPGRCEIDEGPAIPVETAKRLACDCSVVQLTEDERGEPLDVGRKTRSIPPALRRALAARDKGCVFPGCNHKRYVDGHHVEHWADGGETKLSNLATLCRFHHRAVHEGGLRMERCHDGAWRFTNARGESLHGCAPGHTHALADWRRLPTAHALRGIRIDASTATTGWRGERLDYGVVIDSLLYRTAAAAKQGQGGAT